MEQQRTNALLDEVAELLGAAGHRVTVEHPGYLAVELGEAGETTLEVGTVNGPWEIDLCDVRGEVQQRPGESLPADADARAVADWIALAVDGYREAAQGPVSDEERSNGPRR